MARRLTIPAGAPRPLPGGAKPWLVTQGSVEVYLVSAARRRLIALVDSGGHVFPLDDGPLALSLVAVEPAELNEEADGIVPEGSAAHWLAQLGAAAGIAPPALADTEIPAFTVSLDARFAAMDDARDARLASRLGEASEAGQWRTASLSAAIDDAARHFGQTGPTRLPSGEADFLSAPTLARITGLRAAQVILPPDWHRDDQGGPLLLRDRESGAVTLAIWRRGAWRDTYNERIDPAGQDSLAFRLYAPLAFDPSRFIAMAKSILGELRAENKLILGAGFGAAAMGLLVPLATGWIFDDVVPAGNEGLLVAIGIALLVAALATALFGVVRQLAVSRVAGRAQANLLAGIADHVLRLPARFFRTIPAGDFNQRLASIEQIQTLVLNILLTAGLTLAFATIYLVLLFTYEARIAFVGLVLTLVYVAALAISRAMRVAPLREAAARDGQLAALTFEILESLPKLRSAAAEPRLLKRWRLAYGAERHAAAASDRIGTHFSAFADAWQIVTLIGLFAVAAWLAARDVGPGTFIAFLTAFAIFQASFAAFCDALLAITTAQPLAERVRPIVTAAAEAGVGRADPGRLSGDIQASGLSFTYTEGTAPLINGLNFSIRPGEHLAIVGGSGCGKSTILRLLLGFERPATGSLTYDGQELASLDPSRVREQIGVVLQSSQLFAGSIMENIRGASGAGLEQCMLAAERAGLGPDLKAMPMGLHTPITEGAGTLSGGQRQRILIARALVAEPAILFFDEATSALDNATQAIVAATLDRLEATRVTIAHRLSTVRHADRIGVLEAGRFVETGTFSELMAQDGAFAALARRQLLED